MSVLSSGRFFDHSTCLLHAVARSLRCASLCSEERYHGPALSSDMKIIDWVSTMFNFEIEGPINHILLIHEPACDLTSWRSQTLDGELANNRQCLQTASTCGAGSYSSSLHCWFWCINISLRQFDQQWLLNRVQNFHSCFCFKICLVYSSPFFIYLLF